MRIKVDKAFLVSGVGLLAAMSMQARATTITTDLGVLTVDDTYNHDFDLNGFISVDPTGISGFTGTQVDVPLGTGAYSHSNYAILPNPGTFDFTFSVVQKSIFELVVTNESCTFTCVSSISLSGGNTVFPVIQDDGQSFLTDIILDPSTTYTLALNEGFDLPEFPRGYYRLDGSVTPVSAVPLPAALPMFGATLAGLVGFGRRRPRRG